MMRNKEFQDERAKSLSGLFRSEIDNSLFSYLRLALKTFGAVVILYIVLALLCGDIAKDASPIFAFGSVALSVPVLIKLAALTLICSLEKFLFLTDRIIKKMGIVMRTCFLTASVILTAIAFIFAFDWFPTDNIYAWAGFVCSFLLCFVFSFVFTSLREKIENRKMKEALEKIKKE